MHPLVFTTDAFSTTSSFRRYTILTMSGTADWEWVVSEVERLKGLDRQLEEVRLQVKKLEKVIQRLDAEDENGVFDPSSDESIADDQVGNCQPSRESTDSGDSQSSDGEAPGSGSKEVKRSDSPQEERKPVRIEVRSDAESERFKSSSGKLRSSNVNRQPDTHNRKQEKGNTQNRQGNDSPSASRQNTEDDDLTGEADALPVQHSSVEERSNKENTGPTANPPHPEPTAEPMEVDTLSALHEFMRIPLPDAAPAQLQTSRPSEPQGQAKKVKPTIRFTPEGIVRDGPTKHGQFRVQKRTASPMLEEQRPPKQEWHGRGNSHRKLTNIL